MPTADKMNHVPEMLFLPNTPRTSSDVGIYIVDLKLGRITPS